MACIKQCAKTQRTRGDGRYYHAAHLQTDVQQLFGVTGLLHEHNNIQVIDLGFPRFI